MLRALLTGLSICLVPGGLLAATGQPGASIWELELAGAGEVRDLAIASDGSVIAAGFRETKRGNSDSWVAKFDVAGNQIWSSLLGSPVREEALAVATDADGSIAAGGIRYVGPLKGRAFLSELNAEGEVVWRREFTELGSFARQIDVTDGKWIVSGGEQLTGQQAFDGFVALVGRDGTVNWQYRPPRPTNEPAASRNGQISHFEPFAGFVFSRADGAIEFHDREFGSDRCAVLGRSTGNAIDVPCSISREGNAGLRHIAGNFLAGATATDYRGDPVIRKVDSAGLPLWERSFATSEGDGLNDVAAAADGGAIGVGYVSTLRSGEQDRDALILKVDATGAVVWVHTLGSVGRDELNAVVTLRDGAFLAGGCTAANTERDGRCRPWLIRVGSNGEVPGPRP